MAANENEITLKSLMIRLGEWLHYLLSKWIIIVTFAVICAIIGICYAWYSKPKYTADLTFVLSSGNDVSGLASLAGQFGFDVGGGNDDAFSGDNIIQLLESERMIKDALFTKIPDTHGCLINLLIDKEGIMKGWINKKYLHGQLPFPCDENSLTPTQDSLISELHEHILTDYLTIDKVDKKLSYYRVSVTTANEKVSVIFANALVDQSSKFYIQTKTKSAKENLGMMQHEADSLRNLLGSSITSAAEEADKTFNLNPAYQAQRSPAQQSQLRTSVLAAAYGEVVKNLEIAKITLQKSTPLYQIIDTPHLPLKEKKLGKLLGVIIGGFIGAAIIIFILLIKKIYKETFNR